MTKRFPAFALWRSTARFSREVLTPSTTSGRSRYSAPSPPTRRWCWRISKSTRNPTKFRRRKSFWKNSALRTASSRSTRCTVKKNVRGRGGCERASDRSAERKPVDLVRKSRGCVPRRHTPLGGVRTIDDKKSNRHETRIVGVSGAAAAVAGTEWEPHVAAIIQVERTVHAYQPATGLIKTSAETSFYLSNRPIGAAQAAAAIRKHRGIENGSHHVRDVTLREDASRLRKNPGIFAKIRSFAYNIPRFNQRDSVAQDRYAAALGGLNTLLSMNFCNEIPWGVDSSQFCEQTGVVYPLSPRRRPMSLDHHREELTAIRTNLGAIFVSLELSRSIWLITSLSPGSGEKMSKHRVSAGDIAALLTRFSELKQKAFARTGKS